MKNRIQIMIAAMLLIFSLGKVSAQEVTMQSLLREMVDREKLAEFPAEIPYRTLQRRDGMGFDGGQGAWSHYQNVGSLFLLWLRRYERG